MGFSRSRALNALENQARIRHQIVPVVTNVNPRTTNALVFDGAPTAITPDWFRQIYGEDAVEVEIT